MTFPQGSQPGFREGAREKISHLHSPSLSGLLMGLPLSEFSQKSAGTVESLVWERQELCGGLTEGWHTDLLTLSAQSCIERILV